MTVCIAALFRWNYGTVEKPKWEPAAITVSDRMITAGDIQYEPQQLKIAFITPRVLVLIAGDYTVHSQAVWSVQEQNKGNEWARPLDIARMYGSAVQAIQRRQAEDLFLAPLGLNTDSLLAQQKEMSESAVASLMSQMQGFEGYDISALVVGIENQGAHIYSIDRKGTVNCSDDVGFASIGIGAWHANSRLMQAGYVNRWNFAPVLAATYAAKRAAETAPGVGKATDIYLIFRDGWVQLWPETFKKVEELYGKFELARNALTVDILKELQVYLNDSKSPKPPKQEAAATPPTNGGGDSEAARPGDQEGPEHKTGETS